jgi:hypothetical protein
MAAIVAPAGARSIARTWACLVPAGAIRFDEAGADRARDLLLPIFRAAERVATLVLDLALVMGSSEVRATPSAAPPQPCSGKTPAGQDPKAASAAPSPHSNAPIEHGSQSILSKIVAQPKFNDCGRALSNSHAGDLLGRGGSLFLVGRAPRLSAHRFPPARSNSRCGATDGGLGNPRRIRATLRRCGEVSRRMEEVRKALDQLEPQSRTNPAIHDPPLLSIDKNKI